MLPWALLCATSNAAALSAMTLDFDRYLYTVISFVVLKHLSLRVPAA